MDNYDDNEEELRAPIPSKNDILIDDNKDFLTYKKELMKNKNINFEMRQILLQSREEYILNQRKSTNINKEISKRAELFIEFNNELILKAQNDIIYKEFKIIIDKQITDYINGIIETIILDFEIYYNFKILLDEININSKIKNKLNNIIMPIDEIEYQNYCTIIEESKKEYENKKI